MTTNRQKKRLRNMCELCNYRFFFLLLDENLIEDWKFSTTSVFAEISLTQKNQSLEKKVFFVIYYEVQ